MGLFSQKRTLGDQAWFGLALLDVYRQTGLTDTLVSLDGSGIQPPAPTQFPGYYLDLTDIYRSFDAHLARVHR